MQFKRKEDDNSPNVRYLSTDIFRFVALTEFTNLIFPNVLSYQLSLFERKQKFKVLQSYISILKGPFINYFSKVFGIIRFKINP